MKKLLVRGLIAVVVLLIVVVVIVGMSLNGAIKRGIETFGPQLTKSSVTVDDVHLSLWRGHAAITGLVIGNPEGYKSPEALSIGQASVSLSPRSLLSDKVVVKSIRIEAPHVTVEVGPGGSNLQRLQKELESAVGGSPVGGPGPADSPAGADTGKKLQVDEVIVTGGKLMLGAAALGGTVVEAPLPEIKLNGLGQGPDGITGAELGRAILSRINEAALKTYGEKLGQAGAEALQNISQHATNALQEATSDVLNQATKGLDNLLGPKKK
ncbi:MAG TPA: hypothetical protein PKN95_05105 [Verrucomicrobiota bacterium]|nr:hypothetical protein [Verrucomicrobiota bacterium]HNT15170.1 hypothetical protein [Verrucomicrobiota bacterium]